MGHLALLVGTSSCPADSISFPDLPATINDVKGLREVLLNKPSGIFERVTCVINQSSHDIGLRTEEFVATVSQSDLLLFYYSGHGKKDALGRLYLATQDSQWNRLKSTTFAVATLSSILSDCLAQRIIVILDCCHSGAAALALTKSGEVEALREITEMGSGRYVITSSGALELSWMNSDYPEPTDPKSIKSLFTHHMIEGITTEAADANRDGLIDIDELFNFASKQTRKYKPRQRPTITKLGAQGKSLFIARTSRKRKTVTSSSRKLSAEFFPLIGPFVPRETSTGAAQTGPEGNAYLYEKCHIVSAWNFVSSQNNCKIAVIAGVVDRSLPSFRDVKIDRSN